MVTRLRPEDLIHIHTPLNLVTNPRNKFAVYTTSTPSLSNNNTIFEVYLVNTAESQRLIAYPTLPQYDWISETELLISHKRGSEWVVEILNLETKQLSSVFVTSQPILSFEYIGGALIVVKTRRTPVKEYEYDFKDATFSEFDRLPFYDNDRGYLGSAVDSLALINYQTQDTSLFVSDSFSVSDYVYNNGKLYYAGQDIQSIKSKNNTIHVYDIGSKDTISVLGASDLDIKKVLVSGETVYAFASDYETYGYVELPHLYAIKDTIPVKVQNLDLDFEFGNRERDILRVLNHVVTDLYTFNKGVLTRNAIGYKGVIQEVSNNDSIIYFIGAQENMLPEVGYFEVGFNDYKIVSSHHDVIHSKRTLSASQYLIGTEVDAWVIPPIGHSSLNTYPAILYIHGGPHGAFRDVFDFNAQLLANEGYFVIYANPRGSSGRGNDFAALKEQTGIKDYQDLINVVNIALKAYPSIDAARLAATGISYGGYLTNWLISHDTRFKTAISENGVSNWITQALTSDIGFNYVQHYSGDPLVDVTIPWNQSPLKYVSDIEASVLFIHSDLDYRCPISESIQLYTQLKKRQVDTKMVVYHGENHGISRNGSPQNRVHRYHTIQKWFKDKL